MATSKKKRNKFWTEKDKRALRDHEKEIKAHQKAYHKVEHLPEVKKVEKSLLVRHYGPGCSKSN